MRRLTLGLCVCAALSVILEAASVKTKAESDPQFDFAAVRTWSWDGADTGDVIIARTQTDDPAPVKKRLDPLIRRYVEREMTARGLTSAETPDLRLRYYVLVTIGDSAQQAGQFLPAVAYWGLPPFAQATTALSVATKGSLVLDAMLPGDKRVVWRGIAQAKVQDTDSEAVRDSRIQDAARELVKRLPREKKKR